MRVRGWWRVEKGARHSCTDCPLIQPTTHRRFHPDSNPTAPQPSPPEPNRLLQELELAPHGDDPHLEDLGARLHQPLEVRGPEPQLMEQQHLRAPTLL